MSASTENRYSKSTEAPKNLQRIHEISSNHASEQCATLRYSCTAVAVVSEMSIQQGEIWRFKRTENKKEGDTQPTHMMSEWHSRLSQASRAGRPPSAGQRQMLSEYQAQVARYTSQIQQLQSFASNSGFGGGGSGGMLAPQDRSHAHRHVRATAHDIMTRQQRSQLTSQLIAESMLQQGAALPTSLFDSAASAPAGRQRAGGAASRRPSQQTIEAKCSAVAERCKHLGGSVAYSHEVALAARKLEHKAALRAEREQKIRKLTDFLARPPSPSDSTAETRRTDAEIQLLQLETYPQQLALREKLTHAYQRELSLTNEVDFTAYRPHRKTHRPKTTAKQKKQQREMFAKQHQRKQDARSSHNRDLVSWSRQFKDAHTAAAARQRRVHRSAVSFHTHREREEKRKAIEAEKHRIHALKNNDEAAYMKLLENTKNDRLLTLVRETDSALEMLGAKIRAHKAEAETSFERQSGTQRLVGVDASADTGETEQEVQYKDVHPDLLKTKQAYYQVTHTVVEPVTEQPPSLVGGELKEYQIKGLEWLVSLYNNGLNGILADEMGLGKTIQTIALLCHLMDSKGNTGPFLVVVPNSTLPNWSSEFEKWAPKMEKIVYKGGPKVRKAIQNDCLLGGTFNVLITTYEFVMNDKNALAKPKWKYIIVDEGHRIKNHKSKLSVVLGSYYRATNRVLLTGTPLHNNLPELWSLLNFLLPSIFNSVNDFESWFNAPFEKTGEKIEMSEEEELLVINRLHQVLRPFLLRRLKSEVALELPDKVEKVIKCELSSWQTRMYRRVLENQGIYTSKGRPGIQNLNNDLVQLRKICNHPYMFYDIDSIDEKTISASGKVHMLDRILPKLKAAGHRILIFSQMTQLMDILEDYFELRKFTYLRLDGSTGVDDRAESMRKFQEPDSEYFIFLLSTRAGGMGVNLQSADTVIIFDSDWNPQMDKQAQDRAHRIGQRNEVRVLRLISAGTVEVAILNKSREKDSVDQKVIQAGKFNNRSTDSERRAMLESLVNAGSMEPKDDDEPPSEEQLNEMLARDEREIEIFGQVDQQLNVPTLMDSPEDVPEWLTKIEDAHDREAEDEEEASANLGRGARERKTVSYTDNIEIDFSDSSSDSSSDSEPESSIPQRRGGDGKSTQSSKIGRGAIQNATANRGRRRAGRGGRGRGGRGRGGRGAIATADMDEPASAKQERPSPASDGLPTDETCLSCGRADDDDRMILCDGCDNARHTFCCEPKLPAVPAGSWFCGLCDASPQSWRTSIIPEPKKQRGK